MKLFTTNGMDSALDKRGGQTENDLEQGFVKHLLNSV